MDDLHVNPCPPKGLSESQKCVLRGDSIEGTAYNQRWLIKTLMTILKSLHDLLPSLQLENNLTTYDFTPRKESSPNSPSITPDRSSSPPLITSPSADSRLTVVTPRVHDAGTTPQPSESTDTPQQTYSGEGGPVSDDWDSCSLVTLPHDVETIACQLWDMCGDKRLALYLLDINDNIVLHMLAYALKDTTALRLTEVLCGVVCNVCCYSDGCEAVLREPPLLALLVSLPERCTDGPILVQAYRLLYRLVWYLNKSYKTNNDRAKIALQSNKRQKDEAKGSVSGDNNFSGLSKIVDDNKSIKLQNGIKENSPKNIIKVGNNEPGPESASTDSKDMCLNLNPEAVEELSKSLGLVLHNGSLEQFMAFTLQHSCNKQLVSKTVELLEVLLFFWDPNTGAHMVTHYEKTGLVGGLLRVLAEWHRSVDDQVEACDSDEESDTLPRQQQFVRNTVHEDVCVATGTIHSTFVCLYAFVDTKATDDIVSSEGPSLEPPLVRYISEIEGRLMTEIRDHKSHHLAGATEEGHTSYRLQKNAERLGYAVRLLTLLIRSVEQPEVVIGLARLMALLDLSAIYWEEDLMKKTEQEEMKKCNHEDLMEKTEQEEMKKTNHEDLMEKSGQEIRTCGKYFMETCQEVSEDVTMDDVHLMDPNLPQTPKERLSSTDNEGDDGSRRKYVKLKKQNKYVKENKDARDNRRNKSENLLDSLDYMTSVTIGSDLQKSKEKRSRRLKQSKEYQRIIQKRDRKRTRRKSSIPDNSFNDVTEVKDSEEIMCLSATALEELRDLRMSLEAYFGQILQYWFMFGDLSDENGPLCRILSSLEQCHVHEVLPVLQAVKKWDPPMVSKIQEKLLDRKAMPRIVALLAKLYE